MTGPPIAPKCTAKWWYNFCMKSLSWKLLMGLVLSLLFAGCAGGAPERIDGSAFDKSQYALDDLDCRAQAKKKFPPLSERKPITKNPIELPKTDHKPFSIMEFNTCMELKGWKNF